MRTGQVANVVTGSVANQAAPSKGTIRRSRRETESNSSVLSPGAAQLATSASTWRSVLAVTAIGRPRPGRGPHRPVCPCRWWGQVTARTTPRL
jgi:hypothetical protein